MGGIFGGGKRSVSREQPVALNSIRVQTSIYGLALPIIYGTSRAPANLIWYGDFVAIAQQSGGAAGGKGGGGDQGGTTSYTYRAALALALCEGPIEGVGRVWQDKDETTLDALGFALFPGADQAPPWGHLVTFHPAEAIGYEGVAYLAHPALDLGESAGLPNHNFEVLGRLRYSPANGLVDANPADIIVDLLTSAAYGAGFPAAYVGDLSEYRTWCLAAGLLLSPVLDEQREAHEILGDIARLTNSEFVWSQGKLRLLPHADEPIAGNGTNYSLDLTPLFDLDDDDFLIDGAEAPIECLRASPADAFNVWQVEFLNREAKYAPQIAEAKDQANIEAFGARPSEIVTAHEIARADTAQTVAQLLLQRGLYVRNLYRFRLGWKYVLLEPMDVVTVSDPALGLKRQPVRIKEIEENDEGTFTVTAEEIPGGAATAARYADPPVLGYRQNFRAPPGDANPPLIFDAPPELATSGLEVWIAASGGPGWGGAEIWLSSDDATYRRVGVITAPARMGVATKALPAAADPDAVNALEVDLSSSRGTLASGARADADARRTLCRLGGPGGGELISFATADLVGPHRYRLTYLRRGLYESLPADHPPGAAFARLDEAVVRIAYDRAEIGTTVFVKLRSFNIYGGALQDLSEVAAYPYTIKGPPPPPAVEGFRAAQDGGAVLFQWQAVESFALAGYELRYGPIGATWEAMSLLSRNDAGTHMTTVGIPPGTWLAAIRAVDIVGQLGAQPATAMVSVANVNDVIMAQEEAPDWPGAAVGLVRHWSGAMFPDSRTLAAAKPGFEVFDHFVDDPCDVCHYTTPPRALAFRDTVRAFTEAVAAPAPGEGGGEAALLHFISLTTGEDDPPMWTSDAAVMWQANAQSAMWLGYSPFAPFDMGTLDLLAARFRVSVDTARGVPVLRGLKPVFDVPPRVERQASAFVSATGLRVDFVPPFHRAPLVQATPQAGQSRIATIEDLSASGFMLHLFDSSGAPVAGIASWEARTE